MQQKKSTPARTTPPEEKAKEARVTITAAVVTPAPAKHLFSKERQSKALASTCS